MQFSGCQIGFGEGHEAPASLWLAPAPGHSFSPVCLQRLCAGQPGSLPEKHGRRVEVACRHFPHVLGDFLSQGYAAGGSTPGGIESRILSNPLLKANSLGSPKALGRKLTPDSFQSCAVTGQVLVRNIGREESCSNKEWFFCVGG